MGWMEKERRRCEQGMEEVPERGMKDRVREERVEGYRKGVKWKE